MSLRSVCSRSMICRCALFSWMLPSVPLWEMWRYACFLILTNRDLCVRVTFWPSWSGSVKLVVSDKRDSDIVFVITPNFSMQNSDLIITFWEDKNSHTSVFPYLCYSMISNDFFRLSIHLYLNWCLLICLFAFPSSCYPFDYRTYAGVISRWCNNIQIVESMISLQALYPELVELSSIQKDFNLTSKLRCGSKIIENLLD